jgi:hypothetical protein
MYVDGDESEHGVSYSLPAFSGHWGVFSGDHHFLSARAGCSSAEGLTSKVLFNVHVNEITTRFRHVDVVHYADDTALDQTLGTC